MVVETDEGEFDLSNVPLRMSERERVIFAVDWSSVTPLFDREIILDCARRRLCSSPRRQVCANDNYP